MNRDFYILRGELDEIKSIDPDAHYDEESKTISAVLTRGEAKSLIPEGSYCYSRKNGNCVPCPFWDTMPNLPEQSSGFCHYLKEGDFTKDGTFLLWDQCKECGVNDD